MDQIAAMAHQYVRAEEDASEQACVEAASLNGIKPERALECEDGAECCEFCPWRDPMKTPCRGDRFKLANGREIEVYVIMRGHAGGPRVSYRFIYWTRAQGGRASYECNLADWPKIVDGATVIRVGEPPSRFTCHQRKNHELHVRLFKARNSGL